MSVRIISTPLVGSSLTRLALDGAGTAWFARAPRGADAWRARGDAMRSALLHQDWLSLLGPALSPRGAAADRLERAAASGFVITSGQQPGLFGGPLYTWWKALSALALADALQELTRKPVAPVFWAATDDSDFAESASTVVATPDGAMRITMPEPSGTGVALAQVTLGDLSHEIATLEAAAGSAPGTATLELVRQAYTADNTIGGAYVQLLRSMLEPLGISVLDAAHPAVRSAGHPLLLEALEKGDVVEAALTERVAAIKAGGHSPQVKVVAGRTLVFSESNGKRDRVRLRDGTDAAATAAEGSLGPNVLLRPIVERSILPTVAYLGGPAEIAYFAQVTAVSNALDVPAPVVLPRWSGFVIEPRIDRILERYRLTVEDFRDPHSVETRLAKASLPDELRDRISALKSSVGQSVEKLRAAEGSDLVTPSVIDGLTRNVAHRVERLERRYAASVKRRGNEALRDAAIARGALFPLGVAQERALNGIPLLARHGNDLLSSVLAEIRAHTARLA